MYSQSGVDKAAGYERVLSLQVCIEAVPDTPGPEVPYNTQQLFA